MARRDGDFWVVAAKSPGLSRQAPAMTVEIYRPYGSHFVAGLGHVQTRRTEFIGGVKRTGRDTRIASRAVHRVGGYEMAHLQKDDALLKRVLRIAGQVAAIECALVSRKDCSTTLHLVATTRGAMNGLMDAIIESHVREHVARPDLSDDDRAAGTEQLIAAIRRYSK